MIAGIGIDIVDVGRISSLIRRYGSRFLARVLCEEEIHLCGERLDRAQYAAGRFAAKEAAFKALGAGRASGIGFHDIAVLSDGGEVPRLVLTGKAWERASLLEVTGAHVSISHERGYAVAVVVLERP
jgi:holo-[acyl-carrier protein] synthase